MRTSLLIIAICLSTAWISQAQWTTTNLSQGTIRMGTAVLGNKAYFAGGMVQINANWYKTEKVEIYDMVTGEWQLINLSQARQWPAGVTCGDSVFFAGGMSASAQPYSRVDIIYNDILWDIDELSVPRFGLSAFSYNNILYFAGGFDLIQDATYDVIDMYNPVTDQWFVDHLSVPRGSMGCVVVDDRVFLAGGCNASITEMYDRVDIYNFSTCTWEIATLSQARGFIAATAAGSKVIFAGGSLGMGIPSDVVDIYDSETDTWSTATLSIPRGFWSNQAVTVNDKAYFVGSGIFNAGWDTDTDTIDIYDPYEDTWEIITMPHRLNDHAVIAKDSAMLIAGGFTFTVFPYGDPRSEVEIWVDPGVGIAEDVGGTPHAVRGWPNPFNESTTIEYELEEDGMVNLAIYNQFGQQMAVMVDERQRSGKHHVVWNAEGIPSGIYYCRYQHGNKTGTSKLILSK